MSYATLHHDNRSRHAVGQSEGTYSASMESISGSEDGSDMDIHEQGDPDENFELRKLTRNYNDSGHLGPTFGPELEDSHSDEEEKRPSFMLYSPDEEESVIRKFDRRLVLFVALLYMLSFLDRSSMFLIPADCSVLTACRYRKCEDCRVIGRLTPKLVAI